MVARRLVKQGDGPRTLYTLAVAYRNGDANAGWAFVTSPQIEALITTQVGVYNRYSYVKEEDLEDLRSDLRLRIMRKLGSEKFNLPTYHDPKLNEAALVAYFKLNIRDLARKAMRVIVSPNIAKTGTRADADIEFSQLGNPWPNFDPRHSVKEPISPLNPVREFSESLTVRSDPIELLDKGRRLRVLAIASRFFENDQEARIGYECLTHYAYGMEHWGEVAEAVGLGPRRARVAKGLALRFQNVMKAAMIEFGEDVAYTTLGIYTSTTETGITLLESNGVQQVMSIPMKSIVSTDVLVKRIRGILDQSSVTFAVLNLDDRSSLFRMSALKALHNQSPIVEQFDIRWLEPYVIERVGPLRRFQDAKRRSLVLAHAKHAECVLKGSAV